MIAQESIEQLKNTIDIVDVVSNYVELKKNGANFKACCPFHDEKTPSFIVSPQKGIYHCFGCGAGGDGIKFIMEYEKLSYPEAIEKLANQFNISLHYTDTQKKIDTKVLDQINDYYKKMLNSNSTAERYLYDRGLHENSLEKFELGYAPHSNDTINFIRANHLSFQEAEETGIVGKNERGFYSRFIERIIFPIHSASGKIIGFGGRTITNHPAKYINSPETKLFNKSRLLYGYNVAKNTIYKHNEIIITEGYLDVIMLHQAGFTQAVATLGTALTRDHLPLLRKGEPKVILAYDGDDAGKEAAFKASQMLSTSSFKGGVVLFGGGQDPADMVKNHQIEALKKLFEKPKPFIPFCLEKIVYSFNLQIPEEKDKALQEASRFLQNLSPLLQEEYKAYLASLLKIDSGYIKVRASNSNAPTTPTLSSRTDPQEQRILKSLLESPLLMDMLLEYIDEHVFEVHQEEFTLLMQNQYEHPKLIKIHIDDKITPLDEHQLKSELMMLLTRFYSKQLKLITRSQNLDFDQKSYLLKNVHQKLNKLKQGEFVPYESFGT